MRTGLLLLAMLTSTLATAGDVDGLITKSSPHGVSETLDRLERMLQSKRITVALRWPHGERADGVDIALRDTEVMIFGNPSIGSHLMTSAQTAGIDLPMKALAWRDDSGQVRLGYNDPRWIARRHGIDGREQVLAKVSNALDSLTDAAVRSE